MGLMNTFQPCRILFVEDQPDTLKVMARLLRDEGHEVVTASCCDDARRAAREHVFDLLIVDRMLPDGAGIELLAEMRERHAVAGIVISGHAGETEESAARRAGYAAYLTKPIQFRDLAEAIRRIIPDCADASAATEMR
jgi:two-component system OmpR family response regulator